MKSRLQKVWVCLDLVAHRADLRSLEQLLSSLDCEIADTNAANLARLDKLLQSGPGLGDRNIGNEESLGDRVGWCVGLVGVLEGNGPVNLREFVISRDELNSM